jgi:hypothetical protein
MSFVGNAAVGTTARVPRESSPRPEIGFEISNDPRGLRLRQFALAIRA